MNSTLTERFLGACRSASPQEQTIIFQTILLLQRAFSQPHEHSGVGLRKLHPSEYWEIRFGLSLRGVLRLREDEAVLLFVGTHDEVRRFLKSV